MQLVLGLKTPRNLRITWAKPDGGRRYRARVVGLVSHICLSISDNRRAGNPVGCCSPVRIPPSHEIMNNARAWRRRDAHGLAAPVRLNNCLDKLKSAPTVHRRSGLFVPAQIMERRGLPVPHFWPGLAVSWEIA